MDNSDVINNTEAFVKERLEGESSGHDWWHIERVTNTTAAKAIANERDAFMRQFVTQFLGE